jgi:hypothetical protein
LFNSNTQVSSTELNRLPIIKPNKEQLGAVNTLVRQICRQKESGPDVDISALERELNNVVYRLYNLTYEEVKVIEPVFPVGRAEYEGREI